MKKVMKVCMAGIVSISILGACSFGKTEEPRNGAVIIGEEQRLKEIVNQHKSEIKSTDLYKVKRAESDGKQVLIMDQKTAEDVVKKGILRESDNDNDTNSSDPITSLPNIPKGKAVMFTNQKNKDIKQITVNDMKINAQYESNIWLGHERTSSYEDIILIVDSATFKKVPVTETHMEILQFNKVYGEDKPFNRDDAEAMQKETEWTKLTKDMENRVNVFDTVSIIKK
ncbi:lipoprotein BA_5634 family protein [Bacillus thuringiensis]|uniref:lipoprotein BA_5634 family protein n=1 Tax=Bacillus thuringiensis TaxID=1428 RepID=UPI003F6CD0AA